MRLRFGRARGEVGVLAPLAGLAALALVAARLVAEGVLPTVGCVFRTLTGLPCPTCGGTTAFARLAAGDVLGGARASPFAALLFLACVGLVLLGLLRTVGWAVQVEFTPRERAAAARLVVAALLANWAWLLWR